MGGVVAVIERSGSPAERGAVRRMVEATRVGAADRRGLWAAGPAGLGAVMFDTTPEAAYERLPLEAGPFVLASDARVDNRAELLPVLRGTLRELGLLSAERPVTDADLILAAYARWGRESPGRIVGDFAFAVWDRSRGVLLLARDPMGVRPLYVHDAGGRFTAATEPRALFAGGVPRRVDAAAFRDLVASGDTTTRDRTVYEGVRLLPNGHAAEVGPHGVSEWAYHELRPAEPPRDDDEVVGRFRDLFTTAVACRTRAAEGIGVQLSGGLDSSAVACVARDLLVARGQGPLKAFTLQFDRTPESDEREYADTVVRSGGFDPVAVPADDLSPLGNLDEFYRALDDGPATGTQHLVWEMYRAAGAAGLRVMLDGVDGDIVVEHGELRLRELARAGDWAGFFYEASLLGDAFGADPRARDLRSVEGDFARGPRYLFSTFGLAALDEAAASGSPWAFARLLTGAVRHGRARPSVVLRRVWRRLLVPAPLLRHLRPEALASPPTVRGRQREKLTDPGLSRSLALMTHAGAAFGLEVSHPFFDVRLVEFCLGLPSAYSLRDGVTRSVLRRALVGVVPGAILDRAAKSTMSPAFDRALFETDAARLRAGAQTLDLLDAAARPPEADVFAAEVDELATAYARGEQVEAGRAGLLAARASVASWAPRLGLTDSLEEPRSGDTKGARGLPS